MVWNKIKSVFATKFQSPKPARDAVLLSSDEYHLNHFGKTKAGEIVWMGSQLNYNHETLDTIDYVFKFVFDTSGVLASSDIQTVGSRNATGREMFEEKMSALLISNPIISPASVLIETFSIIHEGVEFGLIARIPENEDDPRCIAFMPGNTMAFFEPFDSGEYDT